MKKILALMMILALCLGGVNAFASAGDLYPMLVENGYTAPFTRWSEQNGTMNIEFTQSPEGDLNGFTIYINGTYATKECEYLSGNVYAMDISYIDGRMGTMFMVEDYGLNDYAVMYCFLATENGCYDLGCIPGRAEDIAFHGDCTLTTRDRSYTLGTWSYCVDYVLSYGISYTEDSYYEDYALVRMPQDIVTMGNIVTLNVDLPVLNSIMDTEYSATIPAGQRVVMTATDMTSKVHVSTLDGSIAGWVWITQNEASYGSLVAVNGEWYTEDAVFGDIFYAG